MFRNFLLLLNAPQTPHLVTPLHGLIPSQTPHLVIQPIWGHTFTNPTFLLCAHTFTSPIFNYITPVVTPSQYKRLWLSKHLINLNCDRMWHNLFKNWVFSFIYKHNGLKSFWLPVPIAFWGIPHLDPSDNQMYNAFRSICLVPSSLSTAHILTDIPLKRTHFKKWIDGRECW